MFSAALSMQLSLRPGIHELNWGQPDPRLLPVAALQGAATALLAEAGMEALSYGSQAGPESLLSWLQQRITRVEGQQVPREEITVTAGNSDALDQIATLFARAGDVALVESPAYHLALWILRDHGLELVPVPVDAEGLDVAAAAESVRRLQAQGRRVALLYTIPTYQNPTGVCMSPSRKQALIALAERAGFPIVEDDVYRELAYDAPAPPSLWSLAPRGVVLRLGSFAKSLAPGLRLGWVNGSAQQVQRLSGSGLRTSGGGVNHFTAMIVGRLLGDGDFYERQLGVYREAYRARRDALCAALEAHLPAGCRWSRPGGGYFVWLRLPAGLDATALVPMAERHGVAIATGDRFHTGGGGAETLRLAFSLYTPEELADAGRRLGSAVRELC
jgi:DNA-binding transcriptional MocR family regulator